MKKVVTLGEMLLRLSTNTGDRLFQTNQLTMHYGGAEANVGMSLAEFGYDVYFVSKLPDNPLGKGAERHLKSAGIYTDYILKGGERIGTYYLETGVGERSAQVTYDRKHSSFAELTMEEIDFDKIFHETVLFHITGITPALSPALAELTLFALKKAKEKGVMTSFDFNYRSKLWTHKKASEVVRQLLPYIDVCSCGELDAVHLLGLKQRDDLSNEQAKLQYYYETLKEMHPGLKYMCSTFRKVKSASSNMLQGNLYTDGLFYQSKVHHIDPVVDRVGGGDAFIAGILHGIVEQMDPGQIISFATAGSALKHTIRGDASTFTKEEVTAAVASESGKIVR